MTRKVAFTELRRLLEGMEFTMTIQPTHVLFEHTSSKSMVVLRRYRPGENVNAVDLGVVRKTLDERGLMPPEAFERFLSKRSA